MVRLRFDLMLPCQAHEEEKEICSLSHKSSLASQSPSREGSIGNPVGSRQGTTNVLSSALQGVGKEQRVRGKDVSTSQHIHYPCHDHQTASDLELW